MAAITKCCSTCKILKDISLFTKDKSKKDGHYSKCKECCRLKTKNYYQNHPGYKAALDKSYYLSNKDKIIKRQISKESIRRQIDLPFKLKKNISRAIKFNLHRNFSIKHRKSCVLYLTYSMIELKIHLESQFEPWMTWNNYGRYNSKAWNDNDPLIWTWCIDHIIPQSDLPYQSMNDDNFKKCWSLENLRPLSSKQNHIDGVTRIRHK